MANELLRRAAHRALLAARLDARQAAEKMAMHYTTVYSILRGDKVTVDTLAAFARATGIEDPSAFIAIGRPDLAGELGVPPESRHALEKALAQAFESPLREVPPRPVPHAPRAGVVSRFGVVTFDSDELREQWEDREMREFVVDTTSLAPLFQRGDRLGVRRTETADRGQVVLLQATGEGEGERTYRLARYVATTNEGLRVADPNDAELSEPFELPRAAILGVLAYRVTEFEPKKARRKRKP